MLMICICICIVEVSVQVFEVILLCANNIVDLLFLITEVIKNLRASRISSFRRQYFSDILWSLAGPFAIWFVQTNKLAYLWLLSHSVWFEKSKKYARLSVAVDDWYQTAYDNVLIYKRWPTKAALNRVQVQKCTLLSISISIFSWK
jgi:hypothetical protein